MHGQALNLSGLSFPKIISRIGNSNNNYNTNNNNNIIVIIY